METEMLFAHSRFVNPLFYTTLKFTFNQVRHLTAVKDLVLLYFNKVSFVWFYKVVNIICSTSLFHIRSNFCDILAQFLS